MAKQKEEKKAVAQEQAPVVKQKVENIGQAIHVLVQAADLGRKAGVYSWDDLALISQAIELLKNPAVEQAKQVVKSESPVATEE